MPSSKWRSPRALYLAGRRWFGNKVRARAGVPSGGAGGAGFARVSLPYEVMAYFSDAPVNLYQIQQWLYPLERLNETHPVFILTRQGESFRELERRTRLPIINAPRMATIDSIAYQNNVKMAVYFNQAITNFQALRYPDMFHVFLSHGESEKGSYMASNQTKAYDFFFVAGEASVERLRRTLIRYDVDARTRKIGRPQLDIPLALLPEPDDKRTTVLYAPTWEGDRPSMAYGSVESHGRKIARAFTRSTAHRLIYRPHPRTGMVAPSTLQADKEIRAIIEAALDADPASGHRVDLDPTFGPQMTEADLMICDVSAVAIDFLATGKPLIVTAPVHGDAHINPTGFLSAAHWLRVEDLAHTVNTVDGWAANDSKRDERLRWAEHYFGDLTPGSAMRRFLDACDEVIKMRDEFVAEKRERYGMESDVASNGESGNGNGDDDEIDEAEG